MAGKNILVVEDHEALLAAIQDILEAEGFQVSTATDGVQALQMMADLRPDLIVADIMMPRMNGHDFYREVRNRPEWVSIPFIFLTAKAERADIIKGKELGAEDYLTKPFDPQELVVAIRARLGRAEAIRGAAAAEFDHLKQQIITVLGHELRTPLTYVLGYTDLAIEDPESLSPEALQDLLRGVKQGAGRLTQLVEDFLLMIRLDSGQAAEEYNVLARPRQDLGKIVEETVSQYEERAEDSNVALVVKMLSGLPAVELCEPFFTEALGRLVENAIKFSHTTGGTVIVEVRAQDQCIEVAVQDEGIGISEDEIPHLFERFRQIGREHMEQQGTGLGLAIVSELIVLHGGEVIVQSTLGQGSVFTIRLPIVGADLESSSNG